MELLLIVVGLLLIGAGTTKLIRARPGQKKREGQAGDRPQLTLVEGARDVVRPLGNLGRSASRLKRLGLDSTEIAHILGVATGEVELLLASRRSKAL